MDKVTKNKKGLELVNRCSSGYETSSKTFLYSSIPCDQVWWYNVKQFLSYSKNYICKFMQGSSWHDKLFHLYFSFWIWKVWKGTKLQNLNASRTERVFFIVFKELSFGEKIKIWWKIADTSFKLSSFIESIFFFQFLSWHQKCIDL